MRLLLDTSILLWALLRPARLDAATLAMIEDEQNAVLFSIASIWEIAIKSRLGRGGFHARPSEVHRFAIGAAFEELPVLADAAVQVAELPLHHRDPFDRLLIAQAMVGPMRLLTSDAALAQYSELVTLVGRL